MTTLRDLGRVVQQAIRVKVEVSPYCPKGKQFVLADHGHPEIPVPTAVEDADALIVLCHADDRELLERFIASIRSHALNQTQEPT